MMVVIERALLIVRGIAGCIMIVIAMFVLVLRGEHLTRVFCQGAHLGADADTQNNHPYGNDTEQQQDRWPVTPWNQAKIRAVGDRSLDETNRQRIAMEFSVAGGDRAHDRKNQPSEGDQREKHEANQYKHG